jgi:hypothetical protein
MLTNNSLVIDLHIFLDAVQIHRFSKAIRNMLLSYLKNEIEEGVDDFFVDHIKDLESFFIFLDAIEEKSKNVETT